MASMLLKINVKRNQDVTPDHHIITEPSTPWKDYLLSWSLGSNAKQDAGNQSAEQNKNSQTKRTKPLRFQNPWPSFHRPTKQEAWNSLSFGVDDDPCISLAASHVPGTSASNPTTANRNQQAASLLRIQKPDFSFDADKYESKSTWLGHASMLLQLPGLQNDAHPISVLFDPIFSARCSPSQRFGPIRSYSPPCNIEDLPPINVVLISHNHFDHLDYETIKTLSNLHRSCIRFIVPLGNKTWFLDCGIAADRIEELDWWDSASLNIAGSADSQLRVTCTPAQHSSGRNLTDANQALWSSWYLEHVRPGNRPYRIFFAGDAGYQFHGSADWPPRPTKQSSSPKQSLEGENDDHRLVQEYPPCLAFKDIAIRLGPPHLLYLPLALGATWAYLKSFFSIYLPASVDPFPRHSLGVSGAIHMPPWDAVRVLKEMTKDQNMEVEPIRPVAIGIHWGTFVTDQTEVLKTLGQLEWACEKQDVIFGRSMQSEVGDDKKRACFLALNHGQSVIT